MRYENIAEFDTKLTADVVEWRPRSNTLACATYYLDKEKTERRGCIYLLQLDSLAESHKHLKLLSTLSFDKSGILDLKWLDESHMVAIDSNNILSLVSSKEPTSPLKLVQSSDLSPDQTSVGLTLDFVQSSGGGFRVASSDSFGNIYVTRIDGHVMTTDEELRCHDLEIWSLMIDKSDPNIVYSGADDCTLKVWDLRQKDVALSSCQIFEGGVTSIISPSRRSANNNWQPSYLNGFGPDSLLAGSYDERIYVLDKRAMKRCVRESAKMDGGVWKMKLHANRDVLLCACMHTGVNIVELDRLHRLLYYDNHGLNNLAYGCDWSQLEPDLVATCSFYNHSLRLWKIFN